MSNLYVRYFDRDMLALSVEEAIDFLSTIPDIRITSELVSEVRAYAESDIPYPKRYKVRPRVYFILIKTNATTMAEFKANRRAGAPAAAENEAPTKKEIKTQISFSANLYGQAEEEHSGGALAFSSRDLGEDFYSSSYEP